MPLILDGTKGTTYPDGSIGSSGFTAGLIYGLTLSTAGSSATFGVALGRAADATNVYEMILSSAYTKTTSAWAVGTSNGALDTGAIANSTWYHVYLIKRLDTNVVDVIFSTSAGAPTLPSGYTISRRIGSMKTNGSAQWTSFSQDGNTFRWLTPILDASNISLTTTYTNLTVTVPTGIVVTGFGIILPGAGYLAQVRPLFGSDGAPSATLAPLGMGSGFTAAAAGGRWHTLTDTSGQVQWATSGSIGGNYLATEGWIDSRGSAFIANSGPVLPGVGTVIQVANYQTGAYASGSTTIPRDDTIPQNTEGDQYMSLAFTPLFTTSKLWIKVIGHFDNTAINGVTMALFQDSTANALSVTDNWVGATTVAGMLYLQHVMTAGTTSTTTFKIRAGSWGANSIYFNGHTASRMYGGIYCSSITIMEIAQ